MIDVHLTTAPSDRATPEQFAISLERYFRCQPAERAQMVQLPRLHLTPERLPEPFRVSPDRGVVVSTWDSDGVCAYTGIRVDRYVLISSLLALSQWRVLQRNPLLRIEDLIHPAGVRCVFGEQKSVQDFALLLDPPVICPGCVDFYHCLGADTELIALREVIAEAGTHGRTN